MASTSVLLRTALLVLAVAISAANGTTQRKLLTALDPVNKASKWSPGYISATMADAFSDLIRAKAAHKYEKAPPPEVSPIPTGKSKSKDFTFTNIRLRTTATAPEDTQAPETPLLSSLTAASTSGARASAPFTTESVSAEGSEGSLAEMKARLVQYQKLTQTLQEELAVQQATHNSSGSAAVGRRLADAGSTGWDAGALLEKKLALVQAETAALQDKIQRQVAAIQSKQGHNLDADSKKMGYVIDSATDAFTAKSDSVRSIVDQVKRQKEEAYGNVQDFLGGIMDLDHAKKLDKLQGDGGWKHDWF